jgi:hypothetical protein
MAGKAQSLDEIHLKLDHSCCSQVLQRMRTGEANLRLLPLKMPFVNDFSVYLRGIINLTVIYGVTGCG